MKYYSRLGIYKNSTSTNIVNTDKNYAISWNWWFYIKEIKGKLVLNNYSYSNSTSKHQRNGSALFNYNFDLVIETEKSLDDPNCLYDAINEYRFKIAELERAIAKPRSRKSTNEERKQQIEHYKEKIESIETLIRK